MNNYKCTVPIEQLHLTNSKNRPKTKLIKPLKIVIHYTGNTGKGATAQANRNYFNNTTNYASTQYVVDDTQIIECMPWWEVAWAVGASSYTKLGNELNLNGKGPNYSTISIEMCVNSDSNYLNVVENTVSLVVYLLLQTGLTTKDICRHFDITGKQCPYFYLDDFDWNNFLSYVDDVFNDHKEGRPLKIDYTNIINVEILVDSLNIRKGPSVNYDVVTKVNKGEEVIVYEQVEGWYRTDLGWFNSSNSYCRKINELTHKEMPYLKLQDSYGIITSEVLNIRSEPYDSNSINIVGKYEKGQEVELLGEKNGWYKTKDGWILAIYIERQDYRNNVEFKYDVDIYNEKSQVLVVAKKGDIGLLFTKKIEVNNRLFRKVKYGDIVGYIDPFVYK